MDISSFQDTVLNYVLADYAEKIRNATDKVELAQATREVII
jgi:hypothetical protein